MIDDFKNKNLENAYGVPTEKSANSESKSDSGEKPQHQAVEDKTIPNNNQNTATQNNNRPLNQPYIPKPENSTYGLVSMILGIISLVLSFIPLINIIGIICGIISLVFAIKGMKSPKNGMAITGLVLSIIGIALGILMFFAFMGIFDIFYYWSDFGWGPGIYY